MENDGLLSLPDDVLRNILSLVPLIELQSILFVCRRFSKLVRERLVPTVHIFALTSDARHFVSASMPRTANNYPHQNWSRPTHQSLHVTDFGHLFYYYRTYYYLVSLGRFIYVIGECNYLHHIHCRYDTWTKTTSSMAHFRCCSLSLVAAVNGKIYAVGYADDSNRCPIGEYDPIADEWRVVTHSLQCDLLKAVGAGGVLYALTVTNAGLMEGYDPGAGKWFGGMPKPIMPRGCVMCACGTPAGHVYMIYWHDVEEEEGSCELRFSRWEGSGEEWIELEKPVVPDMKHHFRSLVAMKNEMLVAIVNELVAPGEWMGKYVLAYNVADGRWGQPRGLPPEFNSETTLAYTDY